MQHEPVKIPPQPQKQRNGCLTIWLWLVIVFNILGVILSAMGTTVTKNLNLPGWYLPVAIVSTLAVVIFAIGLLRWKAWGFWGLVAMQGASALVNIAVDRNYFSIISAVTGVAVLVFLLNIGGNNKAWNNLE